MKEESWPAAARWILTDFLMSEEGAQRPNATPRFILARDGKILFTAIGNGGWKDRMVPEIEKVTGAKV